MIILCIEGNLTVQLHHVPFVRTQRRQQWNTVVSGQGPDVRILKPQDQEKLGEKE